MIFEKCKYAKETIMENNQRDRVNPLRFILWALLGVAGAAFLALLLGLIVMALWNWLMPELFGLTRIGYWQAWGLVILTHILFKGFHGPGKHSPPFSHHEHLRDREEWKREFRDRFRNSRRSRNNQEPADYPPENDNA